MSAVRHRRQTDRQVLQRLRHAHRGRARRGAPQPAYGQQPQYRGARAAAPGQQFGAPPPGGQFGGPPPGFGAPPPGFGGPPQQGGAPGPRCQMGHDIAPGASYCAQGHPIALDQMQFGAPAGAPQAFQPPQPASPYGAPPPPPARRVRRASAAGRRFGAPSPRLRRASSRVRSGTSPARLRAPAAARVRPCAPAAATPLPRRPRSALLRPLPRSARRPEANPAPPRSRSCAASSSRTAPTPAVTSGRWSAGACWWAASPQADGIDITAARPDHLLAPRGARRRRPIRRSIAVEDTGSTNGTFVNDEHIGFNGRRELRDGDRVRFGGFTTIVKVIGRV